MLSDQEAALGRLLLRFIEWERSARPALTWLSVQDELRTFLREETRAGKADGATAWLRGHVG